MDERERSQQVRETILRLSDERLLAMLSGPAGDYTPEALTLARAELQSRGGLAHVEEQLRAKPPSPDSYVAEYPGEGDIEAAAMRGWGTAFYGRRDRQPDGSYVTTKWLIFAYLPIVPRASYRLRVVSRRSGLLGTTTSYAGHEVPLNRAQVRATYSVVYGGIALALLLLALFA